MAEATPGIAEVGHVIAGRYRIEQVLGRGGMGAVYRARDERSGKAVALKRGFARDERKMKARAALLEREYHTLVQLAHPRIIEVYDYGKDELGPYYTMELLDGTDLGERGRMPWREACALLHDVASSLAILHSRGLVHRDLSARNVRCTADGRAKLIDFGAMVSMGVAKDIVGTPPFMAPEALQKQTLDGRADLFALGALGYFLLTGRHAYPARRIADLRDAWRSTPPTPARLVPDLPPALSALVLQLLALDRGARPPNAAEVMSKLCAIAGLPEEEHGAISKAYLTTPVLVGRERALVTVRKRMLSLARSDGGVLLVTGAAGTGRSRLLDACALEGKLLGATVVRADASDAANGPWGVAQALGAQLFELMPKEAAEAARLSRDVLGHLFDDLRGEASAITPERSLLVRELRDFVLSLSRAQRVLIVVDDVDRIDEPSLALLAALALKTQRHPLLLALSIASDGEGGDPAPLSLLRDAAQVIALEPLSADETFALMRSVFGDVPNLPLCAGRIHALARGNPRATMELAQHLVDRGLARYEGGHFVLPEDLEQSEPLPKTLADSLAARLSRLSPDALELARALALAEEDAPELASYAELTSHGDMRRVFAALDELVAARVLAAAGGRYHFTQQSFVRVLSEPAADSAEAHSRIATLLARSGGDVLRRARHLFAAGRDREAIELLTGVNLLERLPPLSLLEQAVERAEQHDLPARAVHRLRMALISKAPFVLAWDSFQACVPKVLERLERESGLVRYRELEDVPPEQRLSLALTQTQQRWAATPEHDRVFAVGDAIRELARLSGAFCSMANAMLALEVVEVLPALDPLRGLSPAIRLVARLVEASKLWLQGRGRQARALYEGVLARIAEPDRAGLDEAQYARTRLGVHYSIGLLEASLGMDSAERHALVLEGDRELRVNAWRLRQILKLAQGDVDEARECARRAELLQLQEGLEQRYLGTSAGFELQAACAADDLLGVKNALASLELLARHFPGWRPAAVYGQCRYQQMQGDPQGALDLLLANLELAPAGRHVFFCHFAAAHVDLLGELGRADEALAVGDRYLEICDREQLHGPDNWVRASVALAAARTGQHARAVQNMDELIANAESLGRSGLALGSLYEARARIAIWMNDPSGFDRAAARCAEEYNRSRNPALAAKYGRLLEDARHRDVNAGPLDARMLELMSVTNTEEYETVESRMRECVDASDRARCALTMLLQNVESFAGYLYGVGDGGLKLLAGLPERAPDDGLADWLFALVQTEQASDDATATVTVTGEDETGDAAGSESTGEGRYLDMEGRAFAALVLTADDPCGRPRVVAVLAYHVTGPITPPDRTLLTHIAAQLAAHGDVGVSPSR